ncbi:DUF4189 domain-containing protein [Rhizobium calliandrae]|uniref:DUF4189 domain-containing protein n=1 Tax=Rhizobium calliandrae TaxID=1312182 RepID=A0ABT7KB85_9HYPH|nr:DUF4189 domain-containing protein [Rhizobium calliandrae]MDL2405865.1 DUF4189 domain-containing protein [Rhizobium calliandrae]
MRFRSAAAAIGMLIISNGHLGAADLFKADEPPTPPPQEERGIWAAIAYSTPDEKHGFFWGADKRQEAMDIARNYCKRNGGSACVVVSVFRNHRHWDDEDNTGFPYEHCGALAVGKEAGKRITPWSAKSAPTRREAEDLAMKACEISGIQCKIREWVCT